MKKSKNKIKIDFHIKKPSVIDAIMLDEMYLWENKFRSKKGIKQSLRGFG
jgi:hypothetical protein